MPIITEQVTASAELNDQYGVTVWQQKKTVSYTREQARKLGEEILAACDEADTCVEQDRRNATYPKPAPPRSNPMY